VRVRGHRSTRLLRKAWVTPRDDPRQKCKRFVVEFIAGLFSIVLSALCWDYVRRCRAVRCYERIDRRFGWDEEEDKPFMIIPSALGILFLLTGVGLIVLAIRELLR
jgi:hypothetical protein